MNYTPEEVAKLLANRPNQPHYIESLIHRCIATALENANIEIGSLRNTRNYLKAEREQNALLKARKDAIWRQLVSVRGFVASDKLAISYQTMGQYRTELLRLLADHEQEDVQ